MLDLVSDAASALSFSDLLMFFGIFVVQKAIVRHFVCVCRCACIGMPLSLPLLKLFDINDFHILFILSNSYFSEMYTCDKSTLHCIHCHTENCICSGNICDPHSNRI